MKKTSVILIILAVVGLSLAACGSVLDEVSVEGSEESIYAPLAAAVALVNDDKALAVEIQAVENQSRGNASGAAITSGSYSEDFPGIFFIWDSKTADDGYLIVESAVFTKYEMFVLTTKEANKYWDFTVSVQEGQRMTTDGCYVFFLPYVNTNKMNMVFISEFVEVVVEEVDIDDNPAEEITAGDTSSGCCGNGHSGHKGHH